MTPNFPKGWRTNDRRMVFCLAAGLGTALDGADTPAEAGAGAAVRRMRHAADGLYRRNRASAAAGSGVAPYGRRTGRAGSGSPAAFDEPAAAPSAGASALAAGLAAALRRLSLGAERRAHRGSRFLFLLDAHRPGAVHGRTLSHPHGYQHEPHRLFPAAGLAAILRGAGLRLAGRRVADGDCFHHSGLLHGHWRSAGGHLASCPDRGRDGLSVLHLRADRLFHPGRRPHGGAVCGRDPLSVLPQG